MRAVGERDGQRAALLDEQDRHAALADAGRAPRRASRRRSARARATARRAAGRRAARSARGRSRAAAAARPRASPALRSAKSATTGKRPCTQSMSSATPSLRPPPGEAEPQVLVDGERAEDVAALGHERDAGAGDVLGRARAARGRAAGSRRAASGTTRITASSVVDLPAPFGPIRPTISPRPSTQAEAAHGGHGAVAHVDRTAARGRAAGSGIGGLDDRGAGAEVGRRDVEVAVGSRPACPRRASGRGRARGSRSQTAMISATLWSISSTPAPNVVADRADDGGEGGDLGLVQAGRRLVHQHEARPQRERPRDARAAARRRAGARPRGRRRARARPSRPSSSSARRRASRADAPAPSAATSTFSRTVSPRKRRPCWNVRASPARPRRCGGQRVMSLSAELDPPGRRQVEAGEDVDERRLAGAVRADQAEDLVGLELEVDVRERLRRPRTTGRRRRPAASRAVDVSAVASTRENLVDLRRRPLRCASSGPSPRCC